MMKITNIRAGVREISAILLVTSFASSAILCAPAGQSSSTTTSTVAGTTYQRPPTSTLSASSNTQAPANNAAAGRQLSSVASELSSMPSLVSLRDASSSSSSSSSGPHAQAQAQAKAPSMMNADTDAEAEAMGTYDGKNPFADDSLWRIPIHFVREQAQPVANGNGAGSNDAMAKSASEMSLDEQDEQAAMENQDEQNSLGRGSSILDHHQPLNSQQQPRPSASSSPTVISASTDLKTAAGYHHSAPHHYGGGHHGGAGHHDAGHYGAHNDHYGKYFQYASVPYPYAWDFGYRRGNPYHTIERYEHGKGPHFQTKVKWSDKYGGHGVHVWDYNHDDHHSHNYGGGDHHGYDSHAPAHYGSSHHGGGHHYGGHH